MDAGTAANRKFRRVLISRPLATRQDSSLRKSSNSLLTGSPGYIYNVVIVADLLGAFEQAVLLAVWNLADEAYGRAVLRVAQTFLNRQAAAGAALAQLQQHLRLPLGHRKRLQILSHTWLLSCCRYIGILRRNITAVKKIS